METGPERAAGVEPPSEPGAGAEPPPQPAISKDNVAVRSRRYFFKFGPLLWIAGTHSPRFPAVAKRKFWFISIQVVKKKPVRVRSRGEMLRGGRMVGFGGRAGREEPAGSRRYKKHGGAWGYEGRSAQPFRLGSNGSGYA